MTEKATLRIEKIDCSHTTGEAGKDAIYLVVEVDGGTYGCYPGEGDGTFVFKKSGGEVYVDINIQANYSSSVKMTLWEKDDKKDHYHPNDNQKDDKVGSWTIDRHSQINAYTGYNKGYRIKYRIICNPIPAIRVHGIHCQSESFGCDKDFIDDMAQYIEWGLKAAAKVVGTSKRPKAQVAKAALKKAAREVGKASKLLELRLQILEGADDVFLKHVLPGSGDQNMATAAFWPQHASMQKMQREDASPRNYPSTFGFEEAGQIDGADEYFRFPVDLEPVSIRAIENDVVKGNITLGQLDFTPANIRSDIRFGNTAFVEVMPSYGKRSNEGAVYLMCYSIGMEDFAIAAKCDNLGDPNA